MLPVGIEVRAYANTTSGLHRLATERTHRPGAAGSPCGARLLAPTG